MQSKKVHGRHVGHTGIGKSLTAPPIPKAGYIESRYFLKLWCAFNLPQDAPANPLGFLGTGTKQLPQVGAQI